MQFYKSVLGTLLILSFTAPHARAAEEPEAPSQVFAEDITISKASPSLTFSDGVTPSFTIRKSSQGTAYSLLDFLVGSSRPLELYSASFGTGASFAADALRAARP